MQRASLAQHEVFLQQRAEQHRIFIAQHEALLSVIIPEGGNEWA